jgi:hypothetical protein
MPWHHGSTLMGYLETVEVAQLRQQGSPFRLPVQWVNRPNLDFRGFAGNVVSGVVRPGDRIRVQPSGKESTVARIVTQDGDLDQAVAGQAVTLTLSDEIDISRGDVISAASAPAGSADQFEATLVWMHEDPMLPGRCCHRREPDRRSISAVPVTHFAPLGSAGNPEAFPYTRPYSMREWAQRVEYATVFSWQHRPVKAAPAGFRGAESGSGKNGGGNESAPVCPSFGPFGFEAVHDHRHSQGSFPYVSYVCACACVQT